MPINSEKLFISKIKEGYKLDRTSMYKVDFYYLTNKKEEVTVSAALIRKLKAKGIVDSNWDVHLKE